MGWKWTSSFDCGCSEQVQKLKSFPQLSRDGQPLKAPSVKQTKTKAHTSANFERQQDPAHEWQFNDSTSSPNSSSEEQDSGEISNCERGDFCGDFTVDKQGAHCMFPAYMRQVLVLLLHYCSQLMQQLLYLDCVQACICCNKHANRRALAVAGGRPCFAWFRTSSFSRHPATWSPDASRKAGCAVQR